MSLATLLVLLTQIMSAPAYDSPGSLGRLRATTHRVDEVNKILGANRFSYADRISIESSLGMAVIYMKEYVRYKDYDNLTELEVERCVKTWVAGHDYKSMNNTNRDKAKTFYYLFNYLRNNR